MIELLDEILEFCIKSQYYIIDKRYYYDDFVQISLLYYNHPSRTKIYIAYIEGIVMSGIEIKWDRKLKDNKIYIEYLELLNIEKILNYILGKLLKEKLETS